MIPKTVRLTPAQAVALFLSRQRNSTIEEALADAEVISDTATLAQDGAWHKVTLVPGATSGHA
jgi:hypothetical protein